MCSAKKHSRQQTCGSCGSHFTWDKLTPDLRNDSSFPILTVLGELCSTVLLIEVRFSHVGFRSTPSKTQPLIHWSTGLTSAVTLQESDPFWEPADTEVPVGVALIPLNYLAHRVELEDHVTLLNYWAETVGFLSLELRPCDAGGAEDGVEMLQNPMDMVSGRDPGDWFWCQSVLQNHEGSRSNWESGLC